MYKVLLSGAIFCTFLLEANAAPIYIAGQAFDDSAFVSNVSVSSGSFNSFDASTGDSISITDALTDTSLNTYAASVGTSSLDMSFSTNIYNGTGNDLAFFFNGYGINNHINLTIGSETIAYTAEVLWFDESSNLAYSGGGQALAGIFVNLDDFIQSDFTNSALDTFNVSIAHDNWLSVVSGYNILPTPVPVPAAVWLFLSGLSVLGLIKRRK